MENNTSFASSSDIFDVIIVGGGHAGIEAALVNARLNLKTLLITTNVERIGYMSCNPSIGGLAKGHMVRELDILGGEMGFVADETCIQFKRLNSSKGPAVRGSRTQNDKYLYSKRMREIVQTTPCLSVFEGEVTNLILNADICEGVILSDGSQIHSKATIITTGTFMNGVMHVGLNQTPGGRIGDKATTGISNQLSRHGFIVRRLKTGTPARLLNSSIDWSKTIPQPGDSYFYPFSFRSEKTPKLPQVLCYSSRTTEKTHDIIRNNLDKSPMYCGIIEGTGPRYCPSIEDKVMRFSDRDSHLTFLEPESLSSNSIYLQGISTSLPASVQEQFLKTIPGLENVKVLQYGYAVEYDFIEPTQISHILQTRTFRQLFLAGQINGTSGYEEAAVQGFVAGLNAAHSILNKHEFILNRDQAYIGVLIDDLVTKGTKEPYRMLTSRAEHRLILREDNTIDRLLQLSLKLGILTLRAQENLNTLELRRKSFYSLLENTKITPTEMTQKLLLKIDSAPLLKSITLEELLRRPEISTKHLPLFGVAVDDDPNVNEPVEISVKYSGYIKRQNELIEQAKRLESKDIPETIVYKNVRGLSNEEVEKLTRVRPRTLGQAQRISGVNPSAIQALMIHIRGHF